MSYPRPTLPELINDIDAELQSRLSDASASSLPASDAAIMARVLAGVVHNLWGYFYWISKQIIPSTSDDEQAVRHADWWNKKRKEAKSATGSLIVTGNVGAVIRAGTGYLRTDGTQFETTEEITLTTTTANLPVVALVPGTNGNTLAGATMKAAKAIEGVSNTATVGADGLTGGAEIETIAALLERLKKRVQQPPMGGAKYDWESWALEVSGVTRAWCLPLYMGAGTVGVAFVCDEQGDSIIPTAAIVAEVQSYLEDASRCPPGCEVFAIAPSANPLNLSISGLSPGSTTVRAAIEENVRALLRKEAEPGATILITHIREAISTAAGEYDHVLVSPTDNVTNTTTQISTMGTITWI